MSWGCRHGDWSPYNEMLFHICDMIKGNESHVEDFKFWDSNTTKQLKNDGILTETPVRYEYLVTELEIWDSCYATISKAIFATSDSFPLLMSRGWCWNVFSSELCFSSLLCGKSYHRKLSQNVVVGNECKVDVDALYWTDAITQRFTDLLSILERYEIFALSKRQLIKLSNDTNTLLKM